jgi:altronate dehydratase small subunit
VSPAMLMHPEDNVAMALRDLAAGETVRLERAQGALEIVLREAIALCHKFAVTDMAAQTPVRKYGQTIGAASADIAAGSHVHVHNLVSLRARPAR